MNKEKIGEKMSDFLFENRATVMIEGLDPKIRQGLIDIIRTSGLSSATQEAWINELPSAVESWKKLLNESYRIQNT